MADLDKGELRAPRAVTSRVPQAFRALRHRDYCVFFFTQCFSDIGSFMHETAVAWLAYDLSHSVLTLAVVLFATQCPPFFIAPIAGAVADRISRKRPIIWLQVAGLVQAFVLGCLTITHSLTVAHLIILGCIQGCINASYWPVRQAFIVEIIPDRADVQNAVALHALMQWLARFAGPVIGGIVISCCGAGLCFLLNSASFIGVIAAVAFMNLQSANTKGQNQLPFLEHLLEGYQYAFRNRQILCLLSMLIASSFLTSWFRTLLPVFAQDVFHQKATVLGLLMGATGAGSLIGAMLLAMRASTVGLGAWIAAATALCGCGLVAFGLCQDWQIAVGILGVVGLGFIIQQYGINTMLQALVHDDKRGRIMGLYVMCVWTAPFGGLFAGWLASSLGAPKTVLISGVGCLATALLYLKLNSQLQDQR
jgi:MFS family permease